MDSSPRKNTPSRKSSFRSHGGTPTRPAPAVASAGGQPVSDVDAPEAFTDELAQAEGEGFLPEAAPAAPSVLSEAPPPPPPDESLPRGLRLTRSADDPVLVRKVGMPGVLVTVLSLFFLALGGVGGYFLGASHLVAGAKKDNAPTADGSLPTGGISAANATAVDAAFDATKQGQFADARKRFEALYAKHPEWPSMEVEVARAALYQRDYDSAQKVLGKLSADTPNADAQFLLGLLHMTMQEQDKAEGAFARAVALDPARPDFYYFWGECLRRQGKPGEAAEKFRSALTRNQYETAEGLFQLKLWLSEIQADQEGAKGSTAKIDADLASSRPSGAALFAGAARAFKAGKYPEAADFLTKAKQATEPAVFRVILQDPTFVQENFRPEIAPFYK